MDHPKLPLTQYQIDVQAHVEELRRNTMLAQAARIIHSRGTTPRVVALKNKK